MAFLSGWTKRVTLTIDRSKAGGSSGVTNFPMPVKLADMPSTFWSNVKSDGGDIRVTTSDETTEVPVQVVEIDTVGETGQIWFKADTVNGSGSGSDTVFYLYYGNSGASLPAANDTYGQYNVWKGINGGGGTEDMAAVYHLNEEGNTDTDGYKDSTENLRHATGVSMTASSDVAGHLGTCTEFDGSADYIDADDLPLDAAHTAKWSIFCLFNIDATPSGSEDYIMEAYHSTITEYFTNSIRVDTSGNFDQFSIDTTPTTHSIVDKTGLSATNWQSYAVTMNTGGNMTLYVDGTSKGTASIGSNTLRANTGIHIGADRVTDPSPGRHWDGKLSTILVLQNYELNSDWITALHNATIGVATFYTVGSEETNGLVVELPLQQINLTTPNIIPNIVYGLDLEEVAISEFALTVDYSNPELTVSLDLQEIELSALNLLTPFSNKWTRKAKNSSTWVNKAKN